MTTRVNWGTHGHYYFRYIVLCPLPSIPARLFAPLLSPAAHPDVYLPYFSNPVYQLGSRRRTAVLGYRGIALIAASNAVV